jgi:hypothetical protein
MGTGCCEEIRMKTSNKYQQYLLVLAMGCAMAPLIISTSVAAGVIDTIQVLKISPQDERAVIKTHDGNMQVVKVGDVLSDLQSAGQKNNEARVVEITTGRVVIEGMTQTGKETVIIRLEDGKQRMERIRKEPDSRPVLFKPN